MKKPNHYDELMEYDKEMESDWKTYAKYVLAMLGLGAFFFLLVCYLEGWIWW